MTKDKTTLANVDKYSTLGNEILTMFEKSKEQLGFIT
jgi:hypothetical protein